MPIPPLRLARLLLAGGIPLLGAGCAAYRTYWGDVHGHTALSDGQGTVAEYLARARDEAELDFAIVTDHDFGNAPPWRRTPEEWQRTQETVDELTVDGEFIAIAGYEWTSQPKYWAGFADPTQSERLFAGAPFFYNHKNVYFPRRVPALFSAKDEAYRSPDLLAAAVAPEGGLAHNCHPSAGPDGRDQFAYGAASARIIANSEMAPDVLRYEGKTYEVGVETTLREFLAGGGRTGFVGGSDTHEGRPAARTAVLARELTREAILDALRHRRCYAATNARIRLGFAIDGQPMGAEVAIRGTPRISVRVHGTCRLAEVVVVRNGAPLRVFHPAGDSLVADFADDSFPGEAYYYLRVIQADADAEGNPSHAWSSPIWVRRP
ncbi:MAG: CehA/McbA family metallohydrolase [Planctomycetota bacterium]